MENVRLACDEHAQAADLLPYAREYSKSILRLMYPIQCP
jgi:hypothetical protein